MENPRHLRDVYRFPGLAPAASVRSYPSDDDSIILPLRRRRKKRSAGNADKCIAASTISGRDSFAISRVATNTSFFP
jgi:hypothetical protein